jgi:hypothetical protein
MTKEELGWFVGQVREWRRAVTEPRALEADGLAFVVTQIVSSGLPEGLVSYVVLGCEWFFRICTPGSKELEQRRVLATEREMAPPPAFSFSTLQNTAIGSAALGGPDGPEAEQTRARSVPTFPGPPPWLAPWMAGLVVEHLLTGQRPPTPKARAAKLALALVSVLNDNEVDEKDFRERGKALEQASVRVTLSWPAESLDQEGGSASQSKLEPALDHLVEGLQHRYDVLVRQDYPPELRWPEDWPQVLRDRLDMFGAQNVFPADHQVVAALLRAHPRRGGQKRP